MVVVVRLSRVVVVVVVCARTCGEVRDREVARDACVRDGDSARAMRGRGDDDDDDDDAGTTGRTRAGDDATRARRDVRETTWTRARFALGGA